MYWSNSWLNAYQAVWLTKIILPLVALDLVLRGAALWRASQRGQKWWFMALMVINSLGIVPTIYLLTHKAVSPKTKK